MNTTPTTNGLAQRAMLVSLTVRRWAGTLTDKDVTDDVARRNAVSAKRAGHYRKHAVNHEAKTFKATVSAASEARTAFYHFTLPWGHDGTRIVSAENFQAMSAAIRKARDNMSAAADAFAVEFPELIRQAEQELNGLFNPNDYPTDIRSKFGISVSIAPLPQAADFRVNLSPETVAEIKAGIDAETAKTVQVAMQDAYTRLFDHISRMVERLSDPEATFRNSLVDGLQEICDVLPGLNLTADPLLEDLRSKAQAMIANVHPQSLRDSPSVRSAVCQQAADIMATMSGFMAAQEVQP